MTASFDVAVMHDFFVDRLVRVRSLPRLFALAVSKSRQGGGSIHGIAQKDVKGGNAVNLAHALAVLGAKVLLITHSDREHVPLLTAAFKGLPAELRVKPLPPGLTVAFEERVNVMASHSGGAETFGPSLLTGEDWASLRGSKVVASVNWAANREGTDLLVMLRERLGKKAALFFNPSDIRDRFEDYGALVRRLRVERLVDWISLNEFEGVATARALGFRPRVSGDLCAKISDALIARVDIHTEKASFTSHQGLQAESRTRWVKPLRLTGAGDVWDAASIFAKVNGLGDAERLEFANAAGRLYVAGGAQRPPTLEEVRAASA
jgi:ribokinase